MIQDSAYKFAEEKLWPNAMEWDQKSHFPLDVIKESADLGFSAIYTSEENGGTGLSRLDATLIFEALATGCVPTSAYISIHNMCTWMIDKYGSKEL